MVNNISNSRGFEFHKDLSISHHTITVSLSFMSTPLPGSSNDDFDQSKNTIFMKHPPDCQLSSAWLHRMTE